MGRKTAVAIGVLVSALALLNAAPAAATHSVLCRENVSVCPEKNQWGTETFVTSATGFTGSYAEFELPGLVTFSSCTAGKFSGMTKKQVEGPLTGTLQAFFFTSCKPEGCKVESWTGWAWEWTATGGGGGAITVSKPDLTATCTTTPFAFNCKYSASTLSAKFEPNTPPETPFIKDEGTAMTLVGGTNCLVSKANLRFRTSVREPGPLYLTN